VQDTFIRISVQFQEAVDEPSNAGVAEGICFVFLVKMKDLICALYMACRITSRYDLEYKENIMTEDEGHN
jgi:hypothetical protein